MAGKSAVNLDTVLINIESNAGKASSNISKLAKHLDTLRASLKGGFNNLNKLSTTLNSLAPTLNKLSTSSKNLKVIDEITQSLSQLKDIKSPTGLKNAVASLEKLPEIMGKMDTKTFENLARVSNELAKSLTPVAEKMQQIGAGYSAFSKIQNTFGKSASTATKYMKQQKSILSGLRPVVSKLGSGVKALARGISAAFGRNAFGYMKKFHSKAKQVFLSLLGTRTLFTMIRKAVAEYEAFDQELQDFSQNVWRAFGAQLAPVIYYVMDLFKQFVRVIYSVVLALTGIDLIAKANEKAMAGWGKASKDTLGNLQKFDDLNVVEFPKDKGGDDNKLIELDKIDLSPIQKVIDWVRKLKAEIIEAWNSGEWYGVGEVLAEGINMGTATIMNNIGTIRDKFFEIGRDFADLLNGIIQNTNWGDLGKVVAEGLKLLPDFFTEILTRIDWDILGKGINDFFKDFDAVEVANSFGRAFVAGLKGIGTILAQQDWTAFGKTIGTVLVNALKGLTNLLSDIPWGDVGKGLRNAITEMPWSDIWYSIVSLAKTAFQGLEEFIAGLFNLNAGELKTIEGALVGIGIAFATYKIVDNVGRLSKALGTFREGATVLSSIPGFFKSIGTGISNIVTAFSLLGKGTLTTSTISGITGVSKGLLDVLVSIANVLGGGSFATAGIVIGAIVVAVIVLAEAFRQLWDESESFRNSVTELGSMIADTFLTIVDTLWTAIKQGIETFKSFYEKAIKPVFDLLVDIAKPILEFLVNIFNVLWKNVIKPFVGFLSEAFLVTWDLILIGVEALGLVLQPVISIFEWLWKKVLKPIVDFLLDNLLKAFDRVTSNFKSFATTAKNTFSGIRKFLDDMLTAMRGGWKSFGNFIIEKLEWLINKIISGLNWLIKQVNKVSFDVPDWVPGIGGKKWGFNIKQVSEVSLPRLETGTNEIPYEGIYHLHPGEAVVPKKYNPALGNGGSEEMNAKMDTLIELMSNMNFTNVVNIGNKKVYEGQQAYNKMQQNKYGTTNLY